MTATLTRTDAGLASALRISITRLARRLRSQRADSTLSGTQLAALAALEGHGAMTPRELAEHEKVQPPSMTRVVAGLEERGLVTRSPHPTDGRQVLLAPTDEGRALLKEDRRRREAWLSQKMRELSPQERQILRAAAPVLEKLSQS
ncbi:MAG: MarR family winged helix-turn-helix transcriptional regulator [Streptosporangiaceae bacterium]